MMPVLKDIEEPAGEPVTFTPPTASFTVPPSPSEPSQLDRIGRIEKATYAVLPTELVTALSETPITDELERAAKLTARLIDLPPSFLWGETDMSKIPDPLHGGKMRLSTLNRITEGLEPELLAQILPGLLETASPGARKRVGNVTPKSFGRYTRAFVPLAKSFDLDAETAIGL